LYSAGLSKSHHFASKLCLQGRAGAIEVQPEIVGNPHGYWICLGSSAIEVQIDRSTSK
jgi:hypothetical protein